MTNKKLDNFKKVETANNIQRSLDRGYSLRVTINGVGDPIYVICEPGEDPSKGVYVAQVHVNDYKKLIY